MKQNPIYPSWWHDEQGSALREEIENELKNQKSRKKTKSKQHFNQNCNYYKRTTKSKPKRIFEPKIYERIPTQSESNSIYSNYSHTESDYSYDKRLVLNKLTKSQHKNQYEPKSTITYNISYDKNLQPQSIEQKTKETKHTSHKGNISSAKDKIQTTSLSSRNNGYPNETGPEKRTSSTKGDNVYNKEQSNQGSKYESRQHSHQHSHHTSQTHSLLQSQEIAPQTIPNQQQYMTRPQMPIQIQQTRSTAQQFPPNIEHQHFHNQTNSYLTNQQAYTQTNETQTHQYMQSEPLYEEYYEPNHHIMNQQMNYKIISHHEMEQPEIEQQSVHSQQQYEQTPSFHNSKQQPIQYHYNPNHQTQSNPSYQHIQDNQSITGEQNVENISQGNKSMRKQTSQSDVQESQSIKQHQIIPSQEELPLETKELIVEEGVKTIEKQTNEINSVQPRLIKTIEQVNTGPKNKLQQSNHSENLSPGEQLSMIEVNDDLRSKFN